MAGSCWPLLLVLSWDIWSLEARVLRRVWRVIDGFGSLGRVGCELVLVCCIGILGVGLLVRRAWWQRVGEMDEGGLW